LFQHTQLPPRRFKSYFPIVTLILLVQTVLFLLMTISGGSKNPFVLQAFGALVPALVVEGEWWRLVVPIFLHIGVTHFLFNSFSLYILAPQLEWLFGRWRFLLLYLVTGIAGNLATFYLEFPGNISAGASGSIYGLFGVYVYLFLFRKGSMDPDTGKGLLALVGINLLLSVMDPSINLIAHLGGLISGLLLAGPLLRLKKGL